MDSNPEIIIVTDSNLINERYTVCWDGDEVEFENLAEAEQAFADALADGETWVTLWHVWNIEGLSQQITELVKVIKPKTRP